MQFLGIFKVPTKAHEHTCTIVLNCTVYLRRPAVKRTLLSPALHAESMVLLFDAL